jgi:His-Xaa-Ser system radical SAM maturase HxsC
VIHLQSRNNTHLGPISHTKPFIGRVTENPDLHAALRNKYILRLRDGSRVVPQGFALTLIDEEAESSENLVRLAPELKHLTNGDVIKFDPSNLQIRVLFRSKANSNSFLLTERCNSFCVMCSQPPRNADDSYLVDEVIECIPLIPKDTHEIGFTGGETTLVGERLIQLIISAKTHLPNTALHILSNGRRFSNLELARAVARVNHHDVMWGIPLYADTSDRHDFIVQADKAFDETIRGILNLKRCQQRVEIRCVIHKENYQRLPALAEFIRRNMLFVDHVAFMGLEITGFAKSNLDTLWITPNEYEEELASAVELLARSGLRVSIYNHPLCLIPERVRGFSISSISDWKNDYPKACSSCALISECGGLFSWNIDSFNTIVKPK